MRFIVYFFLVCGLHTAFGQGGVLIRKGFQWFGRQAADDVARNSGRAFGPYADDIYRGARPSPWAPSPPPVPKSVDEIDFNKPFRIEGSYWDELADYNYGDEPDYSYMAFKEGKFRSTDGDEAERRKHLRFFEKYDEDDRIREYKFFSNFDLSTGANYSSYKYKRFLVGKRVDVLNDIHLEKSYPGTVRDSEVEALQEFLVDQGYLRSDDVDGLNGPNTFGAYERFISDFELEEYILSLVYGDIRFAEPEDLLKYINRKSSKCSVYKVCITDKEIKISTQCGNKEAALTYSLESAKVEFTYAGNGRSRSMASEPAEQKKAKVQLMSSDVYSSVTDSDANFIPCKSLLPSLCFENGARVSVPCLGVMSGQIDSFKVVLEDSYYKHELSFNVNDILIY